MADFASAKSKVTCAARATVSRLDPGFGSYRKGSQKAVIVHWKKEKRKSEKNTKPRNPLGRKIGTFGNWCSTEPGQSFSFPWIGAGPSLEFSCIGFSSILCSIFFVSSRIICLPGSTHFFFLSWACRFNYHLAPPTYTSFFFYPPPLHAT